MKPRLLAPEKQFADAAADELLLGPVPPRFELHRDTVTAIWLRTKKLVKHVDISPVHPQATAEISIATNTIANTERNVQRPSEGSIT